MKWSYETYDKWIARPIRWHKWFAWYPVYSHVKAWWLCYCERKYLRNEYLGDEVYAYRDIGEDYDEKSCYG